MADNLNVEESVFVAFCFLVYIVFRVAGEPMSSRLIESLPMTPDASTLGGRFPVDGKNFVWCIAFGLCGDQVVPFLRRFARGENGFVVADDE